MSGNIFDANKGRKVVSLATAQHRVFGPDFPGWGHPDAASFLRPLAAGVKGVIDSVESHGSNPHTRYSVRFEDGTHAGGLVLGKDIAFDGPVLADQITRRLDRIKPGGSDYIAGLQVARISEHLYRVGGQPATSAKGAVASLQQIA